MGGIGENYAQQMLAARGQRHEDDEQPQLEAIGRGLQTVNPVGAIKVAVERDDAKVLQRLKVLASAAGARFYYRFPVKNKDGSSSNIEGPSIDCALAVARTWGNCDVDVRVNDEGDHWIFLARFRDFETGFTLTRAFQQRKGQTTMKTKDPGRALDIVFQIGQSKAIRNVICNALGDVTDFAFEEAKAGFVDRVGKAVDKYRAKSLERLAELKIDVKRVEAVIGKPAAGWLAPDLARVIAELQAIQDGMSSPDDLYPLLDGPGPEEPTRQQVPKETAKPAEETKPKEQAKPAKPAEQMKPAESAKAEAQPEPEPFDLDAFIAEAEDDLAKLETMFGLAELDAEVTETLATHGTDEAKAYWNRVLMKRQGELGGSGAAEEPKEPGPWDAYAAETEARWSKIGLLGKLNADWLETRQHLDEEKAPAEIVARLEAAKVERDKTIKAARK